jgi:hypothetical protein
VTNPEEILKPLTDKYINVAVCILRFGANAARIENPNLTNLTNVAGQKFSFNLFIGNDRLITEASEGDLNSLVAQINRLIPK